MSCLDTSERSRSLAALESQKFDLIVIGGGITGAGILRDASMRGLSVALLEADDFSSGTSSKSTKLIHGGIRYLAMGHVHVVREAARERKRVNRIAPHLAEPTWLTLPSRSRLEWLKYKVGVSVYERLGQVEEPDLHFDLSGSDLEAHEPLLDRDRFPYACAYREYLTDDSRLVLGNIRAGVRAGGIAINKLSVTGLIKDYSRVTGVRATCGLTGQEVIVRGKGVINAAGPWVEQVCQLDGLNPPKSLVLSKGIHVVVSREALPLQQMVLTVTEDNRPVFMIPRGNIVYVGTTDTRYEQQANEWPAVLPEEVAYLFKPVETYTGVRLSGDDCFSTWAGLRPLIAQSGKSTKEISRRDEVWVSQSGLITIAGGKLTGYRKMAEDTVDEACRLLALNRPEPSDDEPLPGGDFADSLSTLALDLTQKYPMPDQRADRLVSLYGSEASRVMQLGAEPVCEGVDIVGGEVNWAIREEGAASLEDLVYRRLRAPYYSPRNLRKAIGPIAVTASALLGWDERRSEREIRTLVDRMAADQKPLAEIEGEVLAKAS
jgi:glycerol-3-phosphate dehydrogenase